MSLPRNPVGSSFDDIMIGHRHLAFGHWLAAALVVTGLWVRIGPQYFATALTFRIGGILLFTTAIAWFPILFSWFMAKQFIFGRKQVRTYLIFLGLVSTAAAFAYAGTLIPGIPAYVVSIVASLLLGISLVLCAVLAAASLPNNSLERTRER
jgi:hypothetical protein